MNRELNRHEQVGEGEKKNATACNCVPMSGPLRRLIGPAKVRLLKYIEEANVTLARAFEDKDCDEEDIATCGRAHHSY